MCSILNELYFNFSIKSDVEKSRSNKNKIHSCYFLNISLELMNFRIIEYCIIQEQKTDDWQHC